MTDTKKDKSVYALFYSAGHGTYGPFLYEEYDKLLEDIRGMTDRLPGSPHAIVTVVETTYNVASYVDWGG